MQNQRLEGMSVEELWNLHEKIVAELTRKMTLEKRKLDERLREIRASTIGDVSAKRERRP